MASLLNAAPSRGGAPDGATLFEPGAGDAPGGASLLNGSSALAAPPTQADAWDATSKAYGDWVAKERADGVAKGLLDPQTGWPTQAALVDAAHQYGSALIGSTAAPGSGSTQIAGTASTYRKALDYLLQKSPNATSVLDYGAGLGLGADAMRQVAPDLTVHTLEPNVERWKGLEPPTFTDDSQITGKYDLITSANVLNVLPQSIRDDVVRDIGDKLAPGGRALITTRGWSGDVGAAKNAVPAEEPNSVYIQRPGAPPVFQRGFTTGELKDYTAGLLGDGFSVEPAPFGKAGVLVTRDVEPAQPAPAGFTAYHGSPHSFDQFDIGKIGTGEGAQAYGHGLYFADREATARSYRDKLSQSTYDGGPYNADDPAHRAAFYINDLNGGDRDATLKAVDAETQGLLDKMAQTKGDIEQFSMNRYRQEAIGRLAAMKDYIESGDPLPTVAHAGSMYQVRVNADPAHFLDWDKPRDQQPANVQAFAQQHYPGAWDNAADGSSLYQGMVNKARQPVLDAARAHDGAAEFLADWQMSGGENGDGGDRASALANIDTQLAQVAAMGKRYAAEGLSIDGTHYAIRAQRLNEIRPLIADPGWSPDKPPVANEHSIVTQQMAQAGIPGIRYLDGGSRSDGSGTSNHVIFDPATIAILRKYGIAGLMAGGAAGATQGQPERVQ